jgi:hypothetical protein
MADRRNRIRNNDSEEYRFKIEAYSPATIPMLRLSEYMQALAQLLGESAHVHFRRVSAGSTILVHTIEREAVPKVRDRIAKVRHGQGPSEAVRAYKAANRLLREDNATGALRNGSVTLKFPGRSESREEFVSVRQAGFVDGIVIGVRGRDESVHITLQIEDRQVSGCYTNRTIAKQLGARFFEPVRLHGRGRWHRDGDGNWELDEFKVDSFETLSDDALTAALSSVRKAVPEFSSTTFTELMEIRHGSKGKQNGGH